MTGHMLSYVMTKTITATQAKAELLGLIDAVASGDSGPVTITKHGKAKVMLVPVPDARPPMTKEEFFGCMAGTVTIPDGFDLTEPVWGDDWVEARDGDEAQWHSSS
jgi:prevent-host-death family protein